MSQGLQEQIGGFAPQQQKKPIVVAIRFGDGNPVAVSWTRVGRDGVDFVVSKDDLASLVGGLLAGDPITCAVTAGDRSVVIVEGDSYGVSVVDDPTTPHTCKVSIFSR